MIGWAFPPSTMLCRKTPHVAGREIDNQSIIIRSVRLKIGANATGCVLFELCGSWWHVQRAWMKCMSDTARPHESACAIRVPM